MVKKVKPLKSYAGMNPDGFVGRTTVFHLIMKTGSVGSVLGHKKGAN